MQENSGKKIYFASDFHLGVPDAASSLEREKLVVKWLDEIKADAKEIFLVGDVFDFWFEFKTVVPRGFVRLLGKIAEIADSGIPIHWFTGNHDMWIFDYIPSELGITLHHQPVRRTFSGKTFFIGHGDGLGPGDHGYKFIKKVFRNKISRWIFAAIHPGIGIRLANYWSGKSRRSGEEKDKVFLGEDKEWLAIYSKEILEKENINYFVFGHRHLPMDITLRNDSRYINLGDWINYFTYGVFDGEDMQLYQYSPEGSSHFSAKSISREE